MAQRDDDTEVLVVPDGPPMRLDIFLTSAVPGLSRRHTRDLIAQGTVRVNGRRAAKARLVGPRDVVSIAGGRPHPQRDLAPQPELLVRVLYEDADLIALDKPPGLPSLALRSGDRDTIANFLVARHPGIQTVSSNPLEAGLVHRLDTGTSGVLLAARTPVAHAHLRNQFRARRVAKRYLALVAGDCASAGSIAAPIAHVPRHARRMCVCPDPDQAARLHARPAHSAFRPLARFGVATLLAVDIRTGVRHQVRVHLASIGHAVLGDETYQPRGISTVLVPRLMLHARRLRLLHPADERPIALRAPLPDDMRAMLQSLRTRTL